MLSAHDILLKETSYARSPGNETGVFKLYGGGPETGALASCDALIDSPVDCHPYAVL